MKDIPEEIKNYLQASVRRKSLEILNAIDHHNENQENMIAATKIVYMHLVLEAITRSLESINMSPDNMSPDEKIVLTVPEFLEHMEDAIIEFILFAKESRNKHENN